MSAATFLTCLQSERQHAVDRYEQWLKLREKAVQNAGGKLPEGFNAQEPAPPPPPVDEDDIIDLSMDLNAVALDAEVPLGELDESGIERVPMADPGMDVSGSPFHAMLPGSSSHSSDPSQRWAD